MSLIIGGNAPTGNSGIVTPNSGIATGNPLAGGMPMVDFGQMMAQVAAQVFEQMTVSSIKVKIKKVYEDSVIPTYETKKAACCDLYAHIPEGSVAILPHTNVKIDTGIALDLPEGFMAMAFARSGLATKQGLRPANGTPIIDEDYKGIIYIPLYNDSDEVRVVEHNQRIAQLYITNYHQADFEEVKELSKSERGENGFGSTGK